MDPILPAAVAVRSICALTFVTLSRWSEDGERIVFHRFEFGSDHGFTSAIVLVEGTSLSAITLGGNYDDTDLDWFRIRTTLSTGVSGPM